MSGTLTKASRYRKTTVTEVSLFLTRFCMQTGKETQGRPAGLPF